MSAARDIVAAMLGASVPVTVWVGPSGARAASAGNPTCVRGLVTSRHRTIVSSEAVVQTSTRSAVLAVTFLLCLVNMVLGHAAHSRLVFAAGAMLLMVCTFAVVSSAGWSKDIPSPPLVAVTTGN